MSDEAVRIADAWRRERSARLQRRWLEPADFTALTDAGYLRLPVSVGQGGGWTSAAASIRTIATTLRTLAAGDVSPTLVAAMHPAVLAFWVANPDPAQRLWDEQARAAVATAAAGAQWGTVTSEPGSGGDVTRSRAVAVPADAAIVDLDVPGRRYLISGDKHFGSGTGVCSFMLTAAVPSGEDAAAFFFLDTRPLVAGDDLAGYVVSAEWDGAGMAATQSHAVRLEGCPAVRLEWEGEVAELLRGAGPINMCVFAAVILGVVDEAVAVASERLAPKADGMRPYERVEWTRAVTEHWLAVQAFEGMVRSIEAGDRPGALQACLRGKVAMAELAESVLLRATRVLGGASYSRSSPFASWFEDVRALGFLRPPWGLMFDNVFGTTFA